MQFTQVSYIKVSRIHRLIAISPWNSGNLSSLNWSRLSLRNDHPLMVSNHCWCSALWNRCLSKSISSCGTALEPSPVVSFLDLFVGSFLGAISCEDTFVKSVLQEIIFYHKKKKTNREKVAFTSSQQNTYVNMNLDKTLHINAWVISRNTYIYSHISLLVKNIS